MPQGDDVLPFHARLKQLRDERGLSQPAFFRQVDGVSFETLRAIERTPDGKYARYPSADVIEKVARALEVPPDEFPEYRLAKAREALDERVVGLHEALGLLTQIEELFEARSLARARHGETPGAEDRQPEPASRPGKASRRA